MEGKFIIASGLVIIEDQKLMVNKDDKDDFYKLPGGTIEEGIEERWWRRGAAQLRGIG